MNCNVIRDLIVLCADGCCSAESRALAEEHIQSCESCRRAYEELNAELFSEPAPRERPGAAGLRRVNDWKASVLQSALLYLSFALLILGVAREAATPAGELNGLWAAAVVVPTTGFLLSLASWYFVRLYTSRKMFSLCSLLAAFGFTVCGYVWAALHYRGAADLFGGSGSSLPCLIAGGFLTALLCALSWLLSRKYAQLLGKE